MLDHGGLPGSDISHAKVSGIHGKTQKRFRLDSASAFPPFLLLFHLLFFGASAAADAVGDIGVAVVGILRGFVIGDI